MNRWYTDRGYTGYRHPVGAAFTTLAIAFGIGGITASVPSPAIAADSLTEQLHTPPTDFRNQRDAADQFLLSAQAQIAAGEQAQAVTMLQAAADAYHVLGDFVGMGEAYEQLVKIYSSLGQYPEAQRVVQQQLAIARSNLNASDQILALNNLGTLSLQRGELSNAQAAFLEALAVAQSVESNRGIGLSLSNLGLIAAAQGQIDDAREYYESAANYRYRARDYAGHANTESNLGDTYLTAGSHQQAVGAYRVSLSIAREIDDPYLQLRALDGLIAIYRQRDEPRMLADYLNDRIDLTLATGDDWQRLITLRTLGDIYEETGNLTAAYESFQRALRIADALERKQVTAELSNRVRSLSLQLLAQ